MRPWEAARLRAVKQVCFSMDAWLMKKVAAIAAAGERDTGAPKQQFQGSTSIISRPRRPTTPPLALSVALGSISRTRVTHPHYAKDVAKPFLVVQVKPGQLVRTSKFVL